MAGGRWAAACALGSGPLPDEARDAAHVALAEERRAEALYASVGAALGPSRPFAPIEAAERRHAAEIERLLAAHGEAASSVPSPEPVTRSFASPAAACAAGVDSEKRTIALYDELAKRDLPEDERCVFDRLRAASAEHHLPAFERCAR